MLKFLRSCEAGVIRKTRFRLAVRNLRQAAAESQGKELRWLGKGDGGKTGCGWGFGGFGRCWSADWKLNKNKPIANCLMLPYLSLFKSLNGLRYLRVSRRRQCFGAEKARSHASRNACRRCRADSHTSGARCVRRTPCKQTTFCLPLRKTGFRKTGIYYGHH